MRHYRKQQKMKSAFEIWLELQPRSYRIKRFLTLWFRSIPYRLSVRACICAGLTVRYLRRFQYFIEDLLNRLPLEHSSSYEAYLLLEPDLEPHGDSGSYPWPDPEELPF